MPIPLMDEYESGEAERRIDNLEEELHSLLGEMRDLISMTRETIRSVMLEQRAELPPPLPAGTLLCDGRHAGPLVYGLISASEPDRVRYVGASRLNAGARYAHHQTDNPRIMRWTIEMEELPQMILLEKCHEIELLDRERWWIHHYRDRGMADLNVAVRGCPRS